MPFAFPAPVFDLNRLVPSSDVVKEAITQVHGFLLPKSVEAPPPTPLTWQEKVGDCLSYIADIAAGRTALENTSVLLAICTFSVLFMSWMSRFGDVRRLSPFTRSPPPNVKVSDADISYITAEDIKNANVGTEPADEGPSRETDVLLLRDKKHEYHVHFPAYSISQGELTIGQIREQAAKKMGVADARQVKMVYRDRSLPDDSRTCRSEGLRSGSEVLVGISDSGPSTSVSEDESSEPIGNQTGEEGRRRRNRGKRSKKKNKREERQRVASANTAPPPPAVPKTPDEKLDALRQSLDSFVPQVHALRTSPPADPAKKDFEYKRLSETILAQILLKVDAVETEGDADARARRKELVKDTQSLLGELDAVVGK